jgi:hypothetical protein
MTTYNFPPTSRYYGIETAIFRKPSGEQVAYLRRRFVPDPNDFALLRLYTVNEGDRLDNVASAVLGDPLAFWRIADANDAMNPVDLTATPGRAIRITLPQGIPGIANA